ncbi:MAG: hypothetical protein ACHQET_02875 [Chitinophagales bacterium]
MKKLLVIIIAMSLAGAASAQRAHVGVVHYYRPPVIVGVGAYAPFYPYIGFGFSPFYPYPYYPYAYGYSRPSKLALQIEDIRNDYRDKIHSAKSDKSLSKSERKEKAHELKSERDQAIDNLKKNYYKS